MTTETFFEKFELFADTPNAVAKMRELVLALAVTGKITDQNESDESVASAYLGEPQSEDLPTNWRLLNFGKFCDIQGGNQPPKSDFLDHPTPGYVRLFQIRDLGDSPVPTYIPEDSTNRFCREGEILIGRYGASVGKVFWAQNGAYNVALAKFIFPEDALLPGFAFRVLKSHFFQSKIAGASRSAQAGFNKGDLAAIDFPLPPLAEQCRIVARVDELMRLCDGLEEQQKERETHHGKLVRAAIGRFGEAPTPANLEVLFHPAVGINPSELRKTILTLAVQGKLVAQDPEDEPAAELIAEADCLFDIPPNWRWLPLSVLGLCRTGKTPPTHDSANYGNGVPFVGPGQITQRGSFTAPEKTITAKGLENSTEADVSDILMVCIGGSIGKAAICREPMGFNQQINSIRLKRDLPDFIFFAITADYFQEQVRSDASGSATPIINKGKWERISVPVPPLEEQRRIVVRVQELMGLVDQLEEQLEESRERGVKLMGALVEELTAR